MSSDRLHVEFAAEKDVAIRVEGLSKCYQLYDKPMHRLMQSLVGGARRFYREFWALRDVSFEVLRGETFGIVGRNGSGKSTLLQMIAGTLSATEGGAKVNGKVAALLELGSGFNPDFSGRENVYLNASILGLSKAQVDARLDDILAFADIGDFIDQPVRNYSSGMVMRLAFSVMTHVDADILIIDEALSVGDAFFTQKCMRYLRSFKERGTLLFVSHDAGSVTGLCDRAVWIDQGRMRDIGSAKDVMSNYMKSLIVERQDGRSREAGGVAEAKEAVPRIERSIDHRRELLDRSVLRNDIQVLPFSPEELGFGEFKARVVNVALLDEDGQQLAWIVGGESVILEITAVADAPMDNVIVGFYVKDRLGQLLFGDNTYLSYRENGFPVKEGTLFRARFKFDMPRLMEGDYFITAGMAEGTQEQHIIQHWMHEALIFKSRNGGVPAGIIGLPMLDIQMEVVE